MFRRRKGEVSDEQALDRPQDEQDTDAAEPVEDDAPPAPLDRSEGPFDVSEVDLEDAESVTGRIDLGGMLVRGSSGMNLQIQVDEASGQVASVLVVLEDAAVQLLAVAAPRSFDLWPETRTQIAADAVSRGGTAEEGESVFGTELRVLMPVQLPDGQQGIQPSRMVGIPGPRWMLRATFLGRAAVEEPAFEVMAKVVRDTVVVRGADPMPPGELLALRLPQEPAAAGEEEESGESGEPQRPTLEDLEQGPTITEIR